MTPVVAVTVNVEVPAGVPGSVDPPPPLLPLPPQLAIVIMNARAVSEKKVVRTRRFDPQPNRKTAPIAKPKPAGNALPPENRAVWGAVVVTVSVVEPLPVTEAGLKLHVLSCGKPAQDAAEKLTVPLYPVWPVMVSVVVPLPPGLEMEIDGGTAAIEKSACTLTTAAAEVEPM